MLWILCIIVKYCECFECCEYCVLLWNIAQARVDILQILSNPSKLLPFPLPCHSFSIPSVRKPNVWSSKNICRLFLWFDQEDNLDVKFWCMEFRWKSCIVHLSSILLWWCPRKPRTSHFVFQNLSFFPPILFSWRKYFCTAELFKYNSKMSNEFNLLRDCVKYSIWAI